jgi:hypothetical protein
MALDSSQFLQEIRARDPHLGLLLENIIGGMNTLGQQISVTPNGKVSPPNPIENLNVVANNGTVHAVLTHNAPVNKQVNYFVEADTSTAFAQPHVFHLGASRSLFTSLPTKDSNGVNLPWVFRAYAQYPGSDPSAHTYFGTQNKPTIVTVGGSAQFTPLASTGSGTALANGTKGGEGLGVVLQRPAIGPKRSAAPSAA